MRPLLSHGPQPVQHSPRWPSRRGGEPAARATIDAWQQRDLARSTLERLVPFSCCGRVLNAQGLTEFPWAMQEMRPSPEPLQASCLQSRCRGGFVQPDRRLGAMSTRRSLALELQQFARAILREIDPALCGRAWIGYLRTARRSPTGPEPRYPVKPWTSRAKHPLAKRQSSAMFYPQAVGS